MKTSFYKQNRITEIYDEKGKNDLSLNRNTLFSTDMNTFGYENNNNFNNFDKDSSSSYNFTNLDNDLFSNVENIFHNDNRGKECNIVSNIDDNEFSKTFQKIFTFNNQNQPFSNQKLDENIYYSKEQYSQNINKEDFSYDLKDYPKLQYELYNANNNKTELNIDNQEKKEEKENKTIIKSKTIKKVKKKVKSKSFPFKTQNKNYPKNGNNIKKTSQRHQNCRQRIIRNFIQDNLIYWICDGKKDKMLKKLGKKKILYDYKKYKGLKLKDIYSEIKEDSYNNKIINAADGDMLIKLYFTFEEAFKVFCFEKCKKSILPNVERRVLKVHPNVIIENRDEFFSKLKSKEQYINEIINEGRDYTLNKESFSQLLTDFEINI